MREEKLIQRKWWLNMKKFLKGRTIKLDKTWRRIKKHLEKWIDGNRWMAQNTSEEGTKERKYYKRER